MALPDEKFREIVFQLLYSEDMSAANQEDMIALLSKELAVTRATVRKAQERVTEILKKKKEIDEWVMQSSVSYAFERIQTVERNVLRLGVFELLYDESIPPKVAIAEAVRLTRKFGTPEGGAFVNAVLDHIKGLAKK